MTRRAYGRTFEEPSCEYDELVKPTIREHPIAAVSVVASVVPFIGLGVVIGALIPSFEFGDNRYGGREAAWRAFVVGSVLQALSLAAVWIAYSRSWFTWGIA